MLQRCLVAFAIVVSALGAVQSVSTPRAAAACDGSTLTAAQLTSVFANPGVGGGAGFAGGDYQHVYALPDGRNLWLFQDVFFSADDDLRDSLGAAAHNAGLIQNGSCWSVVGGPGMNNYIGSAQTTPLVHWFWPMDGAIGYDGMLWIFMVEMRNPNGTGAALGAAPTGTWIARVDPSSLAVVSFGPAPDAGNRLYGWSIASDDTFSYLYGHCYRQFIHPVDSVAQFDSTCMPDTFLARVPKGHFDATPQYWVAGGWTSNPFAAQPLMTRGAANPMGVRKFGDIYVNVTKIDDWWGAWIYVDKAPNPWGPWENDRAIFIVGDRRCDQCGIYHAHLLPYLQADGKMVLSWSNGGPFNLWQANAYLYRPSFVAIDLPTYRVDAPLTGVGMQPRAPIRAVDTRETGQRLRGGTFMVIPMAGKVAPNAVGVVANVIAVAPATTGYLTAWPCGARMPTASILNYPPGRVIANAAHVRLDSSQRLCVFSRVDTDVVVDVTGSYVASGATGLHPVTASRILDTSSGSPLAATGVLTVPVTGHGGVPASGVDAVTVTVTVSDPASRGYVTVWPCGQTRPIVSTLNFQPGDTIANSSTVPLGTGGSVCVYSHATANIAIDVAGWWSSSGSRARLAATTRPLDSRVGAIPVAGSTTVVPLGAFVPVGTVAVIGNVTEVSASAPGTVKMSDCTASPDGTTLSYVTNETRAGLGLVAVSPTRTVCLATSASAHLVFDATVTFG